MNRSRLLRMIINVIIPVTVQSVVCWRPVVQQISPTPTSPLSGSDSTLPRVILHREVGENLANMGRDPQTQTALLSSYRTDGKVKQGRTLLSNLSSIVEIDIRQANYIKEN